MPPPMSVDDWASACAVGNGLAAKAAGQPLPFRMGTCISEAFQPPVAPDFKAIEELCTAAGVRSQGISRVACGLCVCFESLLVVAGAGQVAGDL